MAIEPYKTADTPFAAFLYYHKHVLITVRDDEESETRKHFVFAKKDDTEELEMAYYFGKPSKPKVEPYPYHKAEKFIMKKLREHLEQK